MCKGERHFTAAALGVDMLGAFCIDAARLSVTFPVPGGP